MFLLYRLSLGAPIWLIGVGVPGFSRSEPIVVTPLNSHRQLNIFLSVHVRNSSCQRKILMTRDERFGCAKVAGT
jgi:hypothetical protein